jgi:non-ribosomal peptide synthetase component F
MGSPSAAEAGVYSFSIPRLKRENRLAGSRTSSVKYEHSDLPFQELVRALKPDPRLRRSPLFQVMFGFDSDSGGGPDRLVQIDTNPGTARFDLTLQLNENPKGITGSFEYCTDLFDASSIEQLAAHFVSVVEEVTRHPDQPISSSQLVAKNEPEPAVSERAATSDRSTVASSRIGTLARRLLQRSQKH